MKGIALDPEQPVPLRLRATELALALLSNVWEVATGKIAARAIRSIAAMDDIDRRLLELAGAVKQIQEQHQQQNEVPLTPIEKRNKEIDALLAQAALERKLNNDTKQQHN